LGLVDQFEDTRLGRSEDALAALACAWAFTVLAYNGFIDRRPGPSHLSVGDSYRSDIPRGRVACAGNP